MKGNNEMKINSFTAAMLAALLVISLTACGKTHTLDLPDQPVSSAQPAAPAVSTPAVTPEADADIPAEESAADTREPWKIEFEKSLFENYGVTPDYYEDLGNGVYQVYVVINGSVVPYVAVDSATGDYHG